MYTTEANSVITKSPELKKKKHCKLKSVDPDRSAISSKFVAAKNGQVSSKFAAVKMVNFLWDKL